MTSRLPGPAAWQCYLIAAPPRQPLCDGLVEGVYEGFYIIMLTGYKNNLFSKHDDLF
jgi:hypothetical protein